MKSNFLRTYDIDFIIKEDEGVVVAKIAGPNYIPTKLLTVLVSNTDQKYARSIVAEYGKRIKSMRGVAKCDSKDTFDVEVGKKIAFMKLRRKYNAYLVKLSKRIAMNLVAHYNTLNDFIASVVEIDRMDNVRLQSYGTAAEDVYPN